MGAEAGTPRTGDPFGTFGTNRGPVMASPGEAAVPPGVPVVAPARLVRDEPRWSYRTFNATRGICHLRVYDVPGDAGTYVAVVTELDDNPSASVTNSAEAIRTALLAEYQPLRIVECYPYRPNRYAVPGTMTYDEVVCDRYEPGPTWRRLTDADLAALLPGVDLRGPADPSC